MSFSSVPKILLGLGAFCLLVAAVIFIAVSWSVLGVAGRTATLVVITGLFAAASIWLTRRDLRVAGEALSAVALGFFSFDIVGAETSGWLGDVSGAGLATIVGIALLAGGAGFTLLTRPRLIVPQIAAGLGALIAYLAASGLTDHELIAGHVSAIALLGLAYAAHRGNLPVLAWSVGSVAGLAWLGTAIEGLAGAVDNPTFAQLWLGGNGWSIIVSAATVLLPALLWRRDYLVASASIATLLATSAITLPALEEPAWILTVTTAGVTVLWTILLALLPVRYRPIPLVSAAAGWTILAVLAGVTAAIDLARWVSLVDGSPQPVDVFLTSPEPVTEPVVSILTAIIGSLVLYFAVQRGRLADWLRYAAIATAVSTVITLASYDVALASVIGGLLVIGVGTATVSVFESRVLHRNLAGTLGLSLAWLAVNASWVNPTLTTLSAAVVLGVAAVLYLTERHIVMRLVSAVSLVLAVPVLTYGLAAALEVDFAWVGVPTLLVLGALAITWPRLEIEITAALTGVTASAISIAAATHSVSSLALHLCVAGGVLASSAMIHPTRRALMWPGAGLLVLASWVRLADLDVIAPEPYTMPFALGLIGLGLLQLRRSPGLGTTVALLPGLLLATVPSLLWVLGDPVSLRALILGAGCLALTVAGAALRWTAPIVAGATVGSVLVLRELGPYSNAIPQWVWIGLAGALLTIVGITWERRLRDVRTAFAALGRLR